MNRVNISFLITLNLLSSKRLLKLNSENSEIITDSNSQRNLLNH